MSEFDSHPKCTHLLPTGKELIWSFKFVKDARKELILTSLTEWYKILWILKTAPGAFNFPPRCKRWERCCVYDVFTVCVNTSVIRSRTELITRGARILDHFFLITNNRKKNVICSVPLKKKSFHIWSNKWAAPSVWSPSVGVCKRARISNLCSYLEANICSKACSYLEVLLYVK